MNNKSVILTASSLLAAAVVLTACGKVEIQPKKDSSEDTSSYVYDIEQFLTTTAGDSSASSDSLIVITDDDATTDVDSAADKKKAATTTTKATTTTTRAVTTAIPTTTTPRPTTTTPRPTTTTPAPTTTTTTTTTTPATTTTTTTTTTSATQNDPGLPQIVDEDDSAADIIPGNDSQPSQGSASGLANFSYNGHTPGIGQIFSEANGLGLGAQISPQVTKTLPDGRTLTEFHYNDITIKTANEAIVSYEINMGSTASTQAGLATGMTFSDMQYLYGTNYTVTDDMIYTYTDGNVRMTVMVLNNLVQQIIVSDTSIG